MIHRAGWVPSAFGTWPALYSSLGRVVAATALSALAIGCGGPQGRSKVSARGDVEVVRMSLSDAGIEVDALNPKADVCGDFYEFACGGWVEKITIPSDESVWFRGFSDVEAKTYDQLRVILEAAAKSADGGATESAVGTFYDACLNENAVEQAGVKPVGDLLAVASGLQSSEGLAAALAELHRFGIWAAFAVDVDQDLREADRHLLYLQQSGLGLPDRDDYLNDDASSQALRDRYRTHVEHMLRLAGGSKALAKRDARSIVALETELAKASEGAVELRDVEASYNKISLEELRGIAPSFDWNSYQKALGISAVEVLSVSSREFFAALGRLSQSVSVQHWQAYLRWQVLRSTAGTLNKSFVDEEFGFSSYLGGQEALAPRWKRCVIATDEALSDLVGQRYVQAHFAKQSRDRAERLMKDVGNALRQELQRLPWWDEATRALALGKVNRVGYLVGHPQRWQEYDFDVLPDAYAVNVLIARAFELQRRLQRLSKQVDRAEWDVSVVEVNAFYHPSRNQIVFPAAVLQSPIFDRRYALAVNFGAMGTVVGHELTHGFDDQGALFDARGNLKPWWSEGVRRRFEAMGQCVKQQYSSYEAEPGVKLHGDLTVGEDIADLGGVQLAWLAYRNARDPRKNLVIKEGFSEDQVFFLAMAQSWCAKYREPALRLLVRTDVHSPAKFRVNGPLSNMPEFAEAFSCKQPTAMTRPQVCSVW